MASSRRLSLAPDLGRRPPGALRRRRRRGPPVVFLHGWGLGQHVVPARDRPAGGASAAGCTPPRCPASAAPPTCPAARSRSPATPTGSTASSTPSTSTSRSSSSATRFGGGVAVKPAHRYPDRVRSLVLVNSVGGSAWRSVAVRSIAERPLWDWGLHFPADVWPLPQAARCCRSMLEELLPNLRAQPPWRLAGRPTSPAAPTSPPELDELQATAGCRSSCCGATSDGVIPRAASTRCARRSAPTARWSTATTLAAGRPRHVRRGHDQRRRVAELAESLEPRRQPARPPDRRLVGARRCGGRRGGGSRRGVEWASSGSAACGWCRARRGPRPRSRRRAEPSSSRATTACGLGDRRVGREPHAVGSTTSPRRTSSRSSARSTPSGGGWRERRGLERGDERVARQRVGVVAGRPGPAAVDRHDVEGVEHGAVALVEARRRRGRAPPAPSTSGRTPRRPRPRARPGRPTHRPTSARAARPVSRSSSSTSTQPRSATTRSTDRSGRRPRRGQHGGHVEHLAAADGLGPAALAQHVAVAGHAAAAATGRCSRTRPASPGATASRAEHAHPHGVLARADVRGVRAPAGHVVVQRRPAPRATRRRPWCCATGRPRTSASPRTTRRGARRRGSPPPAARARPTATSRCWLCSAAHPHARPAGSTTSSSSDRESRHR